MNPEELLDELDEENVIDDDGERVSLTSDFEDAYETYRELTERRSPEELADEASDFIDDVPEQDLIKAFGEHDSVTVASYLAVRAFTGLDDETAMAATNALSELVDPTPAKCGKCGFEAPSGGEEWEYVDDSAMGELTQCPECGSTDIRLVD